MVVYVCEDSYEGILTGVYDARMGGKNREDIRLETAGPERDMELFCEYIPVPAAGPKARRVEEAVAEQISREALKAVYKAAFSGERDKADCIYRFLIQGLLRGAGVVHMLQLPEVYRIFEICRGLDNEIHREMEFLRFVQMEEGLLMSGIGPKNDVLVFLAPHFADRLPFENWLIYDKNRKKAVLHPAGRRWFLMELDRGQWEEKFHQAKEEDRYRELWKTLRRSITIEERFNPVCQMNHMPLRYRADMPEFYEDLKDHRQKGK